MWYQKLDSIVLGLGFLISKSEHCVYYKQYNGHLFLITIYVDDMLFFGNIKDKICNLSRF
jgi:hypothetical protein